MIDHETAMKALRSIVKHADKKNIPWALIGGVAMSFYGSLRLTKDVNVIASEILPLVAERQLGFGGHSLDKSDDHIFVDRIGRHAQVFAILRPRAAENSRQRITASIFLLIGLNLGFDLVKMQLGIVPCINQVLGSKAGIAL